MISTADIVIIGGGVQGASLAYHLADAGAGKIVLLEKNYIASGPTAKSSAMIRPLFTDSVYIQLVHAAITRFEAWDEWVGGDPGFVQTGFLRIADGLDADRPAGFPDFDLDLMQNLGVGFEILQATELSSLVASGEFRGDERGIFFPRGGCADPVSSTRSLAAAARRHGVEIIEGVSVTGIQVEQDRIHSVQTDHGRISTRTVVNCGGSWGHRIAALAGIQLPIEIHRVPVCLFRRPVDIKVDSPVLSDGVNQVVLLKADEKFLRAGLFSLEPERVDPDTYDETIAPEQLDIFRRGLHPRYAGMRRTAFAGGFSAIYDMTPDGHPIVGQTPEVEGFWCNCGWSGNGFASAPVFGACLAAEILGSGSEIDLSLFKWPRLSGVKNRRH